MEIMERLRRLGLTDYQSRILTTLFKRPDMPAKEISLIAKVPITKIYSVLDSLSDMGFVIAALDKPRTYRAADAQLIVNALIKNQENALQMLKGESESLIKDVRSIYKNRKPKPKIIYLDSPEAVWIEISKIALRAKKVIRGCGDEDAWKECIVRGDPIKAWYFAALKNHTINYTIMPKGIMERLFGERAIKIGLDIVRYYASGRVRDRVADPKEIKHTFIMKDDDEVLFILKEGSTVKNGILIIDSDLAKGMAKYFDEFWKSCERPNSLQLAKKLMESLIKRR